MLTSIQVRNELGVILKNIPVYQATSDSTYLIKSVDGIDPVKAEIATSTYAGQSGGFIQSTRVGLRNIVIKIGYRPDFLSNQTVQTLRRELYAFLSPKSTVTLRFIDDSSEYIRTITGIVESHETVLFSRDPEVLISVICSDPDFRGPSNSLFTGFINQDTPVSYLGTANTGFILDVFPSRSFGSLRINNFVDPEIYLQGEMLSGDIVRLSTTRGLKYLNVIRNGVTINAIDYVTSGLFSMSLSSVVSKFRVEGSGGEDVPYRVAYSPRYIGI